MRTNPVCTAFALIVCLAATGACAQNGYAPVDASAIIQRSVAVNTQDWKAQTRYGHRELNIKAKIDADGNTRVQQSRTYEVLMIEGSPYERLIAIDNEPLSRERQQQEAIKLEHEISRRQAESAGDRRARVSKYRSQRAEEHLLMQQMVDAFNFRFLREEAVEGVPCYRFAAIPNPNYVPPVEKARVLTGMRGEIWISKQTYHWVRVRAEVTQPVEFGFFIAKVKPGTSFELDQQPVGDFWLPKHFTQNVNASIFGLYGYRAKDETQFSDYHENALHAAAEAPAN